MTGRIWPLLKAAGIKWRCSCSIEPRPPSQFTVVGSLVKLTRSVDERFHKVGDIVDWQTTLTNTGNGDATRATAAAVVDEWPDGKTFLGASHGGTYDSATGIVTWPSVEVPAGQSVDLTVTVTVTVDSDQSGQSIVNPARASVPGCADDVCVEPPGNPCPDRPDFSCAEIEIPTPLIKLTKDTARTVHLEGHQVIYTLVLSNSGAGHAIGDLAATAVDPLPAGLTFVSSEGSVYDPGTRTVSWADIELYAGDQIELQLTVTVDQGTAGSTIVNRAQATVPGCGEVVCVEPPGNPCSDDASWSCAPIQIPKLVLGKTVAEQLVGVDDQVHWQVIVTNAGPTVLSNVQVADQYDPTMEFVSASHAGTATSATTIGWTIPTIGVGETVKLDVATRVLPTAADPATGQVGTQHNKVTVTPTATCVDETCVPGPTVPQDNQCPDNPAWACAEVPGGKVLAITSSTPTPPPTTPTTMPEKATPLAHTGVGEWMPQALAIVAGLILIGSIALYATRRRRPTEEESITSS